MKIAIAGPGRSGTSLLVALFSEWGFSTPRLEASWHSEAQAGLESRIGTDSLYEVDKDPWAYEYLDRIPESVIAQYDALLIPIRDREHASISRSVQERLYRLRRSNSDQWEWDTFGNVPGGSVSQTHREAISQTLARGLWDLLEKATRLGLSPRIINYPRFAHDFDYLWSTVAPIIEKRISKDSAFAGWERIVDSTKIRIGSSVPPRHNSSDIREMRELVKILGKENRHSLAQLSDVIAQRDDVIAQRDDLLLELARVQNSLESSAKQMRTVIDSLVNTERARLDTERELIALISSRSWRWTKHLRHQK